MPKYLLQVNYTLDGVKGVLSKGGSARRAAAQAAAESVGGTLESIYSRSGAQTCSPSLIFRTTPRPPHWPSR